MVFKKTVGLFFLVICLIPSLAIAAKSYNSNKIYSGEISTQDIVFKSGDKFTGGNRISVTVYYTDAAGEVVSEGKGTIKSVTIDGEKVSEWVMTQKSGAVIQLGNTIAQAAYGFTLKPQYAAADSEGYYTLSTKTYDSYRDSEKGVNKKVKLTGLVTDSDENVYIISVGENEIVAIKTDKTINKGDRLNCAGNITEYIDYNETLIPVIECTKAVVQQYEPLKKGDKGADVLAMKERMRVLGYFSASAELSNSYNDTCVERVRAFQKNNGLGVTGIADVETLVLLYSDEAKHK